MSEKLIIKAIAKTYFIILSFLLFIFLTFSSLFILLQYGLYLEKISISNLQARQLYIKWDEKLELSIQEVVVLEEKNSKSETIDYKFLSKSLKVLLHTFDWFDSIVIENVKVKDFDISFNYKESSKGFLEIHSPTLEFSSSITNANDVLKINIEKLQEKTKKLSLEGDLYLDLNAQELSAELDASLNNDANFKIHALVDTLGMKYSAQSKNSIKEIKELIQLVSLPEEIKFWTQDAIDVESVQVDSLHGEIDFKNMQDAYKHLYLKAKANKLIYTYNPALDGIHSAFTDLEFKDGVLYIKPKNAYSYNSDLGTSWLKIDFTQPEELLTLHLLFDGMLNAEMLEILNAYKIKLPFLQKSGSVKTDLTLMVNLMSIDVDAQGTFYVNKGNFNYLDFNIDIFKTKILLDNNDVKVEAMRAFYKDIAKADVKAEFNAHTSEGKIDLLFDFIKFDGISLLAQEKKLAASYTISPKQESIQIAHSLWDVHGQKLSVDALEFPFDLTTLKVVLPATFVELKGIASGFISGDLDMKNKATELLVDILSLSYHGVKFSQSDTPFHVSYKDELSITSPENLFFNIVGTEYKIEKPVILANKEEIILKNSKLTVGKYATTKIYIKHDLEKAKTHVSLSDLVITDSKKDDELFSKKKVLLSIRDYNNTLEVNSHELGTTFTSNKDGWELYVSSLSELVSHSAFLQKFSIDTGDFTLYKEINQHSVGFSANILYPYKLLTRDGVPTNEYKIEGEIKPEGLSLVVNKDTSVFIGKEIDVSMKNAGINVNEVINAVSELKSDEPSDENLTLSLSAKNSYLYISESRKALCDLISLQYNNEILTAQLSHEQGNAGLRLQNKQFHLYGKDFNDIFMHELFAPTKFKGGNLEFSINGTTNEYSGVFYMHNTTVLSYKLLNNILAFINTVPSLVTFSLPGYSSKGLFVEEAYTSFRAKDKIYNFSDIYLKSKELNILGNGEADFVNDTIDLKLNLKTDLASNASQIPLVGYILFDKESVSTTLNVRGNLNDPSIESLLARDIAVAPLNIIKRTLTLPYNLFKDMSKDANASK